MKKLLLILLFFGTAMAAYFPQTALIQGGATLSGSNPIPFRLSDGATFISTLPVSVASLPLPTGASTESTLSTLNGKIPSSLTVTSTRLLVDGSGVTQPISASALPLPTGASTSANQTTGNSSLSSIDTKTPSLVSGKSPVALFDGAGNSLTSLDDGNGGKALEVTLAATNYVLSTANSTTAQLTASSTFTGTIETIFNQQAISILLTCDKTGTLVLNQYIDLAGTRRISSWTYPIAAGVPFSRSFVGNGNYFNLTFQNTGVATTTTLNINTAYGTLPAATNLGNSPVSLDEVSGSAMSLGQKAAASSLPVVLSSDSKTPNFTVTSTTGTVSSGAYSVSIMNTGNADGTVLSSTLSPGEILTFTAPDSNTLSAIAYVATGTTFKIVEVR